MMMPGPSADTAFLAGERKVLREGWYQPHSCLWVSSCLLCGKSGQGLDYCAGCGRQGKRPQGAVRGPPVFIAGSQSYCRRKATPQRSCEEQAGGPPQPSLCLSPGCWEPRPPQGRPQKKISRFPGLPAPGPIAYPGARPLLVPSGLSPRRQCFSSSPFHPPPAVLLSAAPRHLHPIGIPQALEQQCAFEMEDENFCFIWEPAIILIKEHNLVVQLL